MSTGQGRDVGAELKALDTVRRRVAAIGFFSVAIHGIIGLVVVAHILDGQDRHSDATGLLVMSAVVALVTYGGCRFILNKSLWSPVWLVIAMIPTAYGFLTR